MNPGYAIKLDGSGLYMVDAQEPSADFPEWSYPNYEVEYFWPISDGPPPLPMDPPATEEQLSAAANMERDRLLGLASLRIAPLQDAVDLDEATAADIALLKKWKQYRVAVNRVSDQAAYPLEISWPAEPA